MTANAGGERIIHLGLQRSGKSAFDNFLPLGERQVRQQPGHANGVRKVYQKQDLGAAGGRPVLNPTYLVRGKRSLVWWMGVGKLMRKQPLWV